MGGKTDHEARPGRGFARGRLAQCDAAAAGSSAGVDLISEPTEVTEAVRVLNRTARVVEFIAPGLDAVGLTEHDITSTVRRPPEATVRGVWAAQRFHDEPATPEIHRIAASGGVRVLARDPAPVWAVVWDGGRVAMTPADVLTPGLSSARVLLIRNRPLALAVTDLVRSHWRRGVSWNGADEPRMSGRHHRLLVLVAAGRTDTAIATQMGIGSRTVRRYVAELCTQFGVHGRAALTAEAVRLGVID